MPKRNPVNEMRSRRVITVASRLAGMFDLSGEHRALFYRTHLATCVELADWLIEYVHHWRGDDDAVYNDADKLREMRRKAEEAPSVES